MIACPILLLLFVSRRPVPWPRESGADFALAARRQLGRGLSIAAIGMCLAAITLSLLVPMAQLVATSRTWSEFTPALAAGRTALFNSFLYAALAAMLALLMAMALARLRGLGWLWVLFLVPGVLLGIGALSALNRPALDFLAGTAAVVVALLALRYVALARSMIRAALFSVDTELIDAARLDGARGWVLFRRIVLPPIASQVFAAAYLVYLLCLWDVETILLVIPPGGETLALRIFNLLHYGHNAHVNALCMLLLFLALAPLLLWTIVQRVRRVSRRSAETVAAEVAPSGAVKGALMFAIGISALLLPGCSPPREGASGAPLASSLFSHAEIIGSRGTGPGQFNKPRSLALDVQDNLFVVDMTGRVQKFSPTGEFLLSWQMPETDLGKPKGMCRDRDGNIVIIEPHYQRVSHFTPDGKLVAQWGVKGTNAGELTLPRAVAVDTKNNVIVSEYTLVDRVQKFSARGGRVLGAWGCPGLSAGEFNRAEGVCVDAADRIYVADSCNHRIQIFSPDGKFLHAYGKAGAASGDLSYPYDIQVDAEGRQYICEFGNSRIQVFDASHRPLEMIGQAGGAPGEFNNPWSIAFDSKENLYVADSQNHRVQKLVRKRHE